MSAPLYPSVQRVRRALLVFPGAELGGAERQGLHFARYLKAIGWGVCVWSSLGSEGRLFAECEATGIPFASHRFLWPCRKSSLVRDTVRLVIAIRKLRPDVVLSYCSSPNVGCALAWRLGGARACIWGQRNTDDLRGDSVERFALRRVSAVVCNAAHEVEYVQQTLGKAGVPIHVVHNGLDLAPAIRSRREWRSELGIPDGASIVVMLANFRPQKDHKTLLHAWSRIMDQATGEESVPYLVLAGAHQFTHESAQRLAGELGLLSSVRFSGQVKDVSGLLRACDIGVLVSHHEGLSNSVLEYMASGLPVVATDLPANREALGSDALEWLVPAANPDALAQTLRSLLGSADMRASIGQRNRLRADAEFSVERMCRHTEGIIATLLGRSVAES